MGISSAMGPDALQPGLVLVKSQTFTASTQVDVTDAFNASYDNYHVVLEWVQNTSTGTLELKMRDSGGVISSNYGYTNGGSYYSSGSGFFAGYNDSVNETATAAWVMGVVAAYRGHASWDVFGPNLSRETKWLGRVSTSNGSATLTRIDVNSSIRHNATNNCTGFSLIPTAGTVTGTVRVYGYRN